MKTIPYLILLLTLGSLALAGEKPAARPAGDWHGAIALPGTKLEIAVDLKADAKTAAWPGTIDIPAQMLHGFALSDVSVEGKQVSFKMPNTPGEPAFSGTFSADGEKMAGDFRQNSQTFPFALELGAAKERAGETPSHGVPGFGLAGHWQGSLRPGGAPVELRLVLHVTSDAAGALSANIDQGAKGIPVSSVTLDKDAVRLELSAIHATYEGRLSADGAEITGTWKQGAVEPSLVFRRLAAAPTLARPQEPNPPFPYQMREVSFVAGARDITLAGTLTIPEGKGPFPGVAS